jgi:hypothetical protein
LSRLVVDNAITVVVDVVTGFCRRTRVVALERAFVRTAKAVVVNIVALVLRIGTQPQAAVAALRWRGAWEFGQITIGADGVIDALYAARQASRSEDLVQLQQACCVLQ